MHVCTCVLSCHKYKTQSKMLKEMLKKNIKKN